MGFFSNETKRATDRGPSLELLHNLECRACPLNKITTNRNSHMEPTGAKKPLIYVLGEAPNKEDDRNNEQFSGEAGDMLRAYIPKKYRELVRFNNVTRTRDPDNNPPERVTIECCRPSVERDIARSKPKIIFGFGSVPLTWATGQSGIMDWRGRRLPVSIAGHECWYYPLTEPRFLLKIRRDWTRGKGARAIGSELERAFVFDIKRAFEEIENLPDPEVHDRRVAEYGVETYEGKIGQFNAFKNSIKWAMKQKSAGFDYETNKHRPYNKGAKILSAGIGTKEISFAFALHHPESKWTRTELADVQNLLVEFFKAPVRKLVHNLPFEHEWTGFFYGKELLRASPWGCSLMQACTLDERTGQDDQGHKKKFKGGGPLSLNFLCKQHFGLDLKALNAIDRSNLENVPIEDVLKYNAPDAKYHFLLYHAQRKRLEATGLEHVYKRGLRRIPTVVLTQLLGVPIDQDETIRLDERYTRIIRKTKKRIAALPEAAKFEKKFDREFNPESPDDTIDMFKNILKRKEGYITKRNKKTGAEKETYSTDKNVLAKIDHPLSTNILKLRSFRKRQSTYLYYSERSAAGDKDKEVYVWGDGLLHAVFNPGPFTTTFRLSSEDPTLHNMPKRQEGNKEIRKQITVFSDTELENPEEVYDNVVKMLKRHGITLDEKKAAKLLDILKKAKGRIIIAIDYGQIEARVIAMASKDKAFVKSLWDRYDVHQAWALRIAKAYPPRIGGKEAIQELGLEEAVKVSKFRTDIKNQWTFPLFFGAQMESAAGYLKIPPEKITLQYDKFKHEFKGVFRWQDTLMDFYHEHGYVEGLLDRRRRAPLSKNEVINTPIQQSACEIIMDGMCRLSEYADLKNNWNYQPRINIHDELVFDVTTKKLDRYLEKIVTEMLKIEFDFINVPITLEVAIGNNFLEMEEIFNASSDDWSKTA